MSMRKYEVIFESEKERKQDRRFIARSTFPEVVTHANVERCILGPDWRIVTISETEFAIEDFFSSRNRSDF